MLVIVGVGLVIGNTLGGRTADANRRLSLILWPAALIASLIVAGFVAPFKWPFLTSSSASRAYLEGHGRPKTPHVLLSCNCIHVRLPSVGLLPWHFAPNGKSFEVAVDGVLVVNDVPLALRAARGLLQTHSIRVESFMAQGELETVLDDWAPLRQIDFAISLKLLRTRVPAPNPRTPHRRNSHRTNAKRR